MRVTLLVAALFVAGAHRIEASTVSVGSYLGLTASAVVAGIPAGDSDFASQAASTHPLAVSVDARQVDGSSIAHVFGSIGAHWASIESGSVAFDLGLRVSLPSASGGAGFGRFDGWTYTFVTDVATRFALRFDTSATGPGASGFVFDFDRTATVIAPTATGHIVLPFVSPGIHTVQLGWFPGTIPPPTIVGDMGTDASLVLVGRFDWQIQTVPEPSACLLLGTGLLGLVRSAWQRAKRA